MNQMLDTIVLGASMVGLGYAFSHPGSLILEPGELLAPEFTAAFRPILEPACPQEHPLVQSLRQSGILSEKGIPDPLALSAGLFRFAREQQLPILLLARLVSVRRAPQGGYRVEYLTNSGLRQREARRVLDTRPGALQKKSLNVLCHDAAPDTAGQLCSQFPPGVQAFPGGAAGEQILSIPFPLETSLPAARQGVVQGWQQAFPKGGPHITAMAFDFDRMPMEGSPYCGAAFSDPVRAFLAGSGLSPCALPDFACEEEAG